MIIGVGTDILSINRFHNVIVTDKSKHFLSRVYTDQELKQSEMAQNPTTYLATRFAGKEAVFKSLGLANNHIDLREIEILQKETGQPIVILSGKLNILAMEKGISTIKISLSYETDFAIAFAVSESC